MSLFKKQKEVDAQAAFTALAGAAIVSAEPVLVDDTSRNSGEAEGWRGEEAKSRMRMTPFGRIKG
jgi:hypothetical protein